MHDNHLQMHMGIKFTINYLSHFINSFLKVLRFTTMSMLIKWEYDALTMEDKQTETYRKKILEDKKAITDAIARSIKKERKMEFRLFTRLEQEKGKFQLILECWTPKKTQNRRKIKIWYGWMRGRECSSIFIRCWREPDFQGNLIYSRKYNCLFW